MRRFIRGIAQESTDITETTNSDKFVFLGGTVNGSTWRDELIPLLTADYFNPVVENWTEEDVQRENQAKAKAAVMLYVITPKQHGFYVPVEAAVAAVTARDKQIVVVFLNEDDGEVFTEHQQASNLAIKDYIAQFSTTVQFFNSLPATAEFLNQFFETIK